MSIARRVCCSLLCCCAGLGAALIPGRAVAAPLDAEACQRLAAHQQALEARGVRQLVTAGPGQPKALLSADQIANVRQLMEVDGLIRFRCSMDKSIAALKEDPPDEQVDGLADAGQAAGAKPAPAKPKQPAGGTAKSAKAPKIAKKAEPIDNASETAADVSPQDPQPRKPPRTPVAAKKATAGKVDDAYRAPASGDPNLTPLNK